MSDHVSRMLSEARNRLHDADILATSLRAASDSAALLRILALEVLLKAAVHSANSTYKRNHNYAALWEALAPEVTAAVLRASDQADPGRLSVEAIPSLLKNWEFVFKKARYYYEFYENYSLAEQAELGELWLSLGAPEGEAEVRYLPSELRALTAGLLAHLDNVA